MRAKSTQAPGAATVQNAIRFLRDPKMRLVLALSTLAFSIFLALALLSYLWTWEDDQSKLSLQASEYLSSEALEVDNWAGYQGAAISNLLIHKWFGLTSFVFVFVLFVLSFRFIKIRMLPLGVVLKYSAIGLVWGSIALSYVFGDAAFFLGGMHGYFVNIWLKALIGTVGTGFVLLISLIAILLFAFDHSYLWAKMQWTRLSNPTEHSQLSAQWERLRADRITKRQAAATARAQAASQVAEPQQDPEIDAEEAPQTATTTSETHAREAVDRNEFLLRNNGTEVALNNQSATKDLGFEVRMPEEPVHAQTNKEINHLDLDDPDSKLYAAQFDDEDPDDPRPDDELSDEELLLRVERNQDVMARRIVAAQADYDPTLDLPNFKFPPIDLLVDHRVDDSEVTNEELLENKNSIVETLRNFKIEIEKIKAVVGPTVTLYEIIPAPGVRISKIKNLEDDIALSLSALGIRIIAPMPGQGTIGIEVPNKKPKVVSMRAVLASELFQQSKADLPIALGKNISNETYVADLAKMPHLLVAGATGQGKSVGINVILTSLLYKKHPAQLKFVLVDPKKVELTLYDRIKNHYLAQLPNAAEPIITDNQLVVHTLNSLNREMDDRYLLLKEAQVRNIKEYNAKFVARRLNPEKGHHYLPYIVLVIDEFADLIMTAGKEVELPIARLAQLARAIGIHLIVATQRPSANIITGVIKANFPTRLAFKVASMIDSRTILDAPGANQLIGRGDMLITHGSELVRLQCAFVDTPEVEAVAQHIESQRGYPEPFLLPEIPTDGDDELDNIDLSKKDDLFDDAARLVVIHQQGSTSLIQRKLAIGYNRAGRIIDQLEAAGIVGPFEGSKARQVHYQDEYALEQYLNDLRDRFN